MASDRFIYFGKKASQSSAKPEGFALRVPSMKAIGGVIFEFVGTCPSISVELANGRWFLSIEGEPGWNKEHFKECPYRTERFVEVHRGKDNIDVITRQGDPLVGALAEGLQFYLARRLNGRAVRDYL
jgi:hypothetical protein